MTAYQSITKWCRVCGIEKPIDDFSVSNPRRGYRQSQCKMCRTAILCERRRIIRQANPVVREVRNLPGDIGPDDRIIAGGLDWTWVYAIFREVEGFPDYMVASYGAVWSRRVCTGNPDGVWRKLKPKKHGTKGYVGVWVANDFQRRVVGIHQLVATAFLGPCPAGKQCCHGNGNPNDNRITNLRWGTPGENTADSMEHGTFARGSRKNCTKLTEADIPVIRRLFGDGWTKTRIARHYEMTWVAIARLLSGRTWAHVPDEA